jgi:hypothetical protein
MPAMLLNIDKPLKKATLHNSFCSSLSKPYGTKLKPVGRFGTGGGCFEVTSDVDAVLVTRTEWPEAVFVRCPKC